MTYTDHQRDEMLRWADEHPYVEVCGYLWDDGRIVPMRNVAKNPDKFFIMDFTQQTEVVEQYGYPDACYHSHPDADPEPSPADTMYHEQAGLRMLIIADGRIYDYGIPGQEATPGLPEGAEEVRG